MEFSRKEYLSGLPFPSPGDLSNPGIEPGSPALHAGSTTLPQGKALPSKSNSQICNFPIHKDILNIAKTTPIIQLRVRSYSTQSYKMYVVSNDVTAQIYYQLPAIIMKVKWKEEISPKKVHFLLHF